MKRWMKWMGVAVACGVLGSHVQAGERSAVVMGTATPGGGFEFFGKALAEGVNAADASLEVTARSTRGSSENIPLLGEGELNVALVASLPAREAFEGIDRAGPTPLKIISAIYPTFGAFAVPGDSPAQTFSDLVGQKVAWGTPASGLTLLGQAEPLLTVGSYSFLLARADLPEDVAYRLAKAIHEAQPALAKRLTQARDTLPENTWKAAGDPERIHPGVRRYLAELGLK